MKVGSLISALILFSVVLLIFGSVKNKFTTEEEGQLQELEHRIVLCNKGIDEFPLHDYVAEFHCRLMWNQAEELIVYFKNKHQEPSRLKTDVKQVAAAAVRYAYYKKALDTPHVQ